MTTDDDNWPKDISEEERRLREAKISRLKRQWAKAEEERKAKKDDEFKGRVRRWVRSSRIYVELNEEEKERHLELTLQYFRYLEALAMAKQIVFRRGLLPPHERSVLAEDARSPEVESAVTALQFVSAELSVMLQDKGMTSLEVDAFMYRGQDPRRALAHFQARTMQRSLGRSR